MRIQKIISLNVLVLSLSVGSKSNQTNKLHDHLQYKIHDAVVHKILNKCGNHCIILLHSFNNALKQIT